MRLGPDGRRRVYALTGAAWPDSWPSNGLDTSGIAPSRAIRHIAADATRVATAV